MSKDKNKEKIETGEEKKTKDNDSKESAEIKKLKEELDKKNDLLLRTAAEYDNYRKRTQKDLTERYQDAECMIIKKLLPGIDNLCRALASESESYEDLRKGVDMTYRQLWAVFDELGVKSFGEKGEKFDPEIHNAVVHSEDESVGENEILEVFEKGYSLGDRIIRHAMVNVAN